jgi:2-keto-4-pentenoate hydratase/2-oxohepta-3-ene-1,7-dioic acid hydratase in catechol pathway
MSIHGQLATFAVDGQARFGLVTDKGLVDLTERAGEYRDLRHAIEENALSHLVDIGHRHVADYATEAVTFLPPVPAPDKIICVGVNYPDRNAEYKDGQEAPPFPSLFPRFARSFVGHGQPLVRPRASDKLDYEGEVVIVIGKPGRHIAERDALSHIGAVSLANEGTLRDWVRHAKFNVTQGKNFDRSGAIGPWIVPFRDPAQIADIGLTTRVNGELRQDDRTSRMIFSFSYLIAYISTFTTLVPGDVILTGTPTGAGARFEPPRYLKPGDVIEVTAEGIGSLVNGVADEV